MRNNVEKIEKLFADVKQYQSERAEREYQYGTEVFEAQQEKVAKAVSESVTSKAVPVVDGKSR